MERPVTSHPVITTVTIHPDERPPVSETPGVTFVQITPGFFKTWRGFLLLVQLVSRFFIVHTKGTLNKGTTLILKVLLTPR